MGPKIKTYYDEQIEMTSDSSLKERTKRKQECRTENAFAISQPDSLTELFKIGSLSVRKFHLDMLMIGLQIIMITILIQNKK